MNKAWIKIWNTWKGGRKEILNIQATLYYKDPITGYYRCDAMRFYNHGGHSTINYVHESDIVKFI